MTKIGDFFQFLLKGPMKTFYIRWLMKPKGSNDFFMPFGVLIEARDLHSAKKSFKKDFGESFDFASMEEKVYEMRKDGSQVQYRPIKGRQL